MSHGVRNNISRMLLACLHSVVFREIGQCCITRQSGARTYILWYLGRRYKHAGNKTIYQHLFQDTKTSLFSFCNSKHRSGVCLWKRTDDMALSHMTDGGARSERLFFGKDLSPKRRRLNNNRLLFIQLLNFLGSRFSSSLSFQQSTWFCISGFCYSDYFFWIYCDRTSCKALSFQC